MPAVLGLTMALTLAVPAQAAEAPSSQEGKIVILHTNDVH